MATPASSYARAKGSRKNNFTVGQARCRSKDIRPIQGDGEKLSGLVGDQRFDYALYNASIFIFPDVNTTFDESVKCLCPGGKIAFSFYPQLLGKNDEDLPTVAFERLGEPEPRFRAITDYEKASRALEDRCADIRHHCWARPLDIGFLQAFFSIPPSPPLFSRGAGMKSGGSWWSGCLPALMICRPKGGSYGGRPDK